MGNNYLYIIKYFVGHKLTAQLSFSKIAFFKNVLQRTPMQQENSEPTTLEKLCLPQSAAWKWALHTGILESRELR